MSLHWRLVQVVRPALQPEVRCVQGEPVVVLQVQAQGLVVLLVLTRRQAVLAALLFALVQQVVHAARCYRAVLACHEVLRAARVERFVAGQPEVEPFFALVQQVVHAARCYRAVLACRAYQPPI